jgi:hypothetical protein
MDIFLPIIEFADILYHNKTHSRRLLHPFTKSARRAPIVSGGRRQTPEARKEIVEQVARKWGRNRLKRLDSDSQTSSFVRR